MQNLKLACYEEYVGYPWKGSMKQESSTKKSSDGSNRSLCTRVTPSFQYFIISIRKNSFASLHPFLPSSLHLSIHLSIFLSFFLSIFLSFFIYFQLLAQAAEYERRRSGRTEDKTGDRRNPSESEARVHHRSPPVRDDMGGERRSRRHEQEPGGRRSAEGVRVYVEGEQKGSLREERTGGDKKDSRVDEVERKIVTQEGVEGEGEGNRVLEESRIEGFRSEREGEETRRRDSRECNSSERDGEKREKDRD
jgi:hypothetical protein